MDKVFISGLITRNVFGFGGEIKCLNDGTRVLLLSVCLDVRKLFCDDIYFRYNGKNVALRGESLLSLQLARLFDSGNTKW